MSEADAGTSSAELAAYTAATHRHFRLIAQLGGGRVVDDDGALLLAGPHPGAAILNSCFRTDPAIAPQEILRRAKAFYVPWHAHYAVFASDRRDEDLSEAAEASGWRRVVELPAMVLRGRVRTEPVDGAVLRTVDPQRDRATFSAIATPAFADDDEEAAAYPLVFDHPELFEPPCGAVIAELDARPAACAWFVATDGVATIGFVATLPEFRRRGLGRLVTGAVCELAVAAGARLITLQASPLGLPVYDGMGFEAISREVLWAAPAG